MYQALYRKYRPRCFHDVAGQEHVTETLRRQIMLDRLSHAYLFVGTRGTGKTTCAKILSRAVNCLAPVDGEPCNKCASCAGIESGGIFDVLELDAASNNGVDNVRALREEAIYTPASVKKRVYIIDEVHMLSTAAFNALLKILEEPPEHLLFILATTELHKVPATILSRCQRFSFKRLSPAAIVARLRDVSESEGLTLTEDAAEKLASLADGSMRDALSLLDQCASDTTIDLQRVLDTVGLADRQELIRLAEAAANRELVAAMGILGELYDDGRDMVSVLNELAAFMRDMLVYKLSQDSPLLSGAYSRAELSGLSPSFAPERLFYYLDLIRETLSGLSRGGSVKLSTEMCLIRMCDERLSDEAPALLARLNRLEENPASVPSSPKLKDDSANAANAAGAANASGAANAAGAADAAKGDDSNSKAKPADARVTDETPDSKLQPKASDGGVWADILELLKSDVPVHAFLSDSSRVRAEIKDGILEVCAGDQFTVNMIESGAFSEPLKTAAGKVVGREVIIRVKAGESKEDIIKNDKLDKLGKFGIVKYE